MPEPFTINVPVETRHLLDILAIGGILGDSAEEVAAYLIVRGIDDLTRAGVLKLETREAGDVG